MTTALWQLWRASGLQTLWDDPNLRAMCLALICVGSVVASIAPYQSLLAVQVFGLGEGTYALILFAASVVSVTASLTIGVITDRSARRRRAAMVCGAAGLIAAMLVALVQAPWAFVVAHLLLFPLLAALFGQIFGMVRLITQAMEADARDAVLAAVRALFAVPFVVVLPLWALTLSLGFPLRGIYAVLVVFNLCLLATIWRFWPRDGAGSWQDTASGLSVRAGFAEVLAPRILIRTLCVGAIVSGASLYMVILGLTFEAAPSRTTSDVAIFAGFLAGLEVPVMLSMALILARMRRLTAILLGGAIYAVFLTLIPRLADTSAVWLLMIPGALGGAIMLSLPLAYLQDLMGTRAGAGGALLALQLVISQGTAALTFALGIRLGDYTLVATLGAVAMCAGMAGLWRLDHARVPTRKL